MSVVLCEDHRLLLEALATALAQHGHVVEAAVTNPVDAVRAVERHDPDVLLTDQRTPDQGTTSYMRVLAESRCRDE